MIRRTRIRFDDDRRRELAPDKVGVEQSTNSTSRPSSQQNVSGIAEMLGGLELGDNVGKNVMAREEQTPGFGRHRGSRPSVRVSRAVRHIHVMKVTEVRVDRGVWVENLRAATAISVDELQRRANVRSCTGLRGGGSGGCSYCPGLLTLVDA